MSIDFASPDPSFSSRVGILPLERGILDGTTWVPPLRLNGDELRFTLAEDKTRILRPFCVSIDSVTNQ